MEATIVKLGMGALMVAAVFDIVTHGTATGSVIASGGKAVANLLAVLTGQKATA